MNHHLQDEYLRAKVSRTRLPVFDKPADSQGISLKRLRLAQGELAQFHNGELAIHYLAWIELLPGSLRGNHYHKVKEEYIYVLKGQIELMVQDVETRQDATIALEPGDLAFIATGVAHTLRPVTPGHAVEFSAALFDAGDIYRHVLVTT